ncbi:Calcium-binding protein cml38 [Thalictrum thalictroides]|uniref:Calcium-binding protein cml38 n=1 Tax=Thalictrum thalictroides TaxID=46969 RepID=A0A7J6W490_THATH|nr:Calcium-binding protein cml38 [Thalictrum thalictroides]
MKSNTPSPTHSLEGSIGSSGSTSPTQSVFGKLRRKLSPRKSDSRQETLAAEPVVLPRKISSINTHHATNTLSIDPKASKCGELEPVFRFFDEDKDGKISPAELQSCVKTIGGELSTTEAVTLVESLDSDGDGLLGLEDFAKLMEANGEEEQNKDLREAFGMYENNGSGCITPTSLNQMLSRLGDSKTIEECKSIIQNFDLNGDGVLSFEEFRVMMK